MIRVSYEFKGKTCHDMMDGDTIAEFIATSGECIEEILSQDNDHVTYLYDGTEFTAEIEEEEIEEEDGLTEWERNGVSQYWNDPSCFRK